MVNWDDATLSLESKQIHYYYSKSGNGRPLIFLHGIMDNGLCYNRVAEQFLDQYDIYLLDARGHGQSSDVPNNSKFQDLVDDVKDFCDAHQLRDVTVMGHSMGGATAALFAATYPEYVRAVILEDPGFMSGFQSKFLGVFAVLIILFFRHQDTPKPLAEFEKRSKRMNSKWDPVDQMVWAKAQQEFTTHYPRKIMLVLKGMPKGTDIIGQIQAPTLLLSSERGLIKEKLVHKLQVLQPALQWHYVAGTGHNIRREQFDEEIAAVKEFLDQLP
jgi:pimeloyl-ACP methyl ester carboxylesterase